jgi:hypothetical protein
VLPVAYGHSLLRLLPVQLTASGYARMVTGSAGQAVALMQSVLPYYCPRKIPEAA